MALLVRNAALTGYLDLIRSRGADPLPLLRCVGLHVADLAIHNQWIAIDAAAQLLEKSAAETGLENFGLRLAGNRTVSNLGPIGIAAQGEPDMRSVLRMLSRYQHLRSEAIHVRIAEIDGLATVKFNFDLSGSGEFRQFTEVTVGAFLRLMQIIIGSQWKPVTVCLAHEAPADLTLHHRILGGAIRFGGEFNGIVLHSHDLDAPNFLCDPAFQPYAKQYIETIASPRPEDELDRIRDLIEAMLPTGRCSLQQIAKTLGVNRVTVHRLLARSNTSFSAILNATRAELARRYVGHRKRSLTEVAELLGFSELSAFSRWFRTEFGSSPTAWRAEHPGGD
ncbi:AraC family transcriptional regulator [Streptomyces sp. NBC_00873]|uniref:AraC family transcriptional regulator n=1 Tax=unclassified Streptomyces TaxID=2593676 RepID=UPI00386E1E3C|nr:AraC family transcriptional regulator [Streptomyces sp. NBC_00873]WTA47298.1 AraC family transcriptional regulator [Streptomyces sp. NBC_00842]